MPLTKIVKALAPELRDADNLNAGTVPEARLRESLREAGKSIPSQDYNLAVETGFYAGIGAPTGANAPPELAKYGTLIVGRSAATYIYQIAGFGSAGVGVNEAQLYYRGSNNNGANWGGWKRVFHQGSILGTVSHSSGYPTGAIIERGSNANGEYTKFADGTMICWGTNTGVTSGSTILSQYGSTAGNLYYLTKANPLPANFASGNYLTHAQPLLRGAVSLSGFSAGPSQFSLELVSNSTGMTIDYAWSAIGRWF